MSWLDLMFACGFAFLAGMVVAFVIDVLDGGRFLAWLKSKIP
jgi:hypothetical protein